MISVLLPPNNVSISEDVYQLSATYQVNSENPQGAEDHSAYSYPSFTVSDQEQTLPVNLSSQPSILSVIPMIGPLHISLNNREHIQMSYDHRSYERNLSNCV